MNTSYIYRTVAQGLTTAVAASYSNLTIKHTTALNAAALVFGGKQHRELTPFLNTETLPPLHTGLNQRSLLLRVGQAADYLCNVVEIPQLEETAKNALARQIVAIHDAEIVRALDLDAKLNRLVTCENQLTVLVSSEPWRLFGIQRELARRMSNACGFGHGVVSVDNSLNCDLHYADSLYPDGSEFYLPRNSLLSISKDHSCNSLTIGVIPADSEISLMQQVCNAHLYGRAPNTNVAFLDDAAALNFVRMLPLEEQWQQTEIFTV